MAISKRSRDNLIWQAFLASRYQLVLSGDILLEYEEVLHEHAAPGTGNIILKIFADSPGITYKHVYYNWNAIATDPDDNKFFDAAVAASADYLVTNDNYFNNAKNLSFPKVNIVSADELLQLLEGFDIKSALLQGMDMVLSA